MSTISASTTSTTAYKVTADTTGTLVLQTGSTPTTAATIDASQNVGINNPTSTIRTKLMVSSSNASDTLTVGTASGGFSITNTNSTYGLQFGSLSTGNSWIQSARLDGTATAYNLLLQLGGGNVGIGLTSPAYLLDIGATGNSNTLNINGTASVLRLAGSSYGQIASTATLYLDAGTSLPVVIRPNGSTEAGRFTPTGQLLIGKTTGNTYLNVYTAFDYLTTTFTSGAGNYGYLALPQTPSSTLMLVDLTNTGNGNLNASYLLLVNTRSTSFGGGNGVTVISTTQGSTGTSGEINSYAFAITGSGSSLSLRATCTIVSGTATIQFSARIIQI